MSVQKPQHLEHIEDAIAALEAIVAQDVPRYSDKMTPEAKDLALKEIVSRHGSAQGVVREARDALLRARGILEDYNLSKDPDVERLARDILVSSYAGKQLDNANAYSIAAKHVEHRTLRRAKG